MFRRKLVGVFWISATLLCGALALGKGAAAPTTPGFASGDADAGLTCDPVFQSYFDQPDASHEPVFSIVTDQKGYIWSGAQDGAQYFNGRQWVWVDLPNRTRSSRVNVVLPTADGAMWFATNGGGLARLKDGEWSVLDSRNSGLPSDTIWSLIETRTDTGGQALWAGTSKGLVRYADGVWTVFDTSNSGLPSNLVWTLRETQTETGGLGLWVGTTGGGLARFADGVWTVIDTRSGLPHDSVRCVLERRSADGRRVLWVGTDDGLARLEGGVWTVFKSADSGLPSNFILCATGGPDPASPDLWVGTDGGLAWYSNGAWRTFRTANASFPNNYISGLNWSGLGSNHPILWVGTGGGLVRTTPGAWTLVDTEGENDAQYLMTSLQLTGPPGGETIWVAVEGGLAVFEHGRWVLYTAETSALPGNRVLALAAERPDDAGSAVWVGTASGLARVEGGRWTTFTTSTSNIPNNSVYSLLVTGDERGERTVWVGTNGGGLGRFERGQWTAYTTQNSSLPDDRIDSLAESVSPGGERTLWIGTAGGLARMDGSGWRVYTSANSGLPSDRIRSLCPSRSNAHGVVLWIGTNDGGLARFEPDAGDGGWTVFSDATPVALPSNSVSGIVEDEQGRIYASTKKGVCRLTPRAATPENPSPYALRTFTREDGLASNFTMDVVLQRRANGPARLLVGTDVGLAVYDPVLDITDAAPAPLYIERMTVADRGSLVLGQALDHTENNIRFEFALLSYRGESKTRYRSQLEGFEEQPTDWTTDYTRTYTNLSPGQYTFKVWGRDAAGTVSGPVSASFTITPAPWRTWWAYVLYTIGLGALAWAGLHLRVRTLQNRAETLQRMVEERTAQLGEKVEQLERSEAKALEANRAKSVFLASMSHELRTPLNAILGFVQLMERRGGLDSQHRDHLSIVARSGEHLLGLINDVLSISKIEAGRLELQEEPFDLRRMLENLDAMMSVRARMKGVQLLVESSDAMPRRVRGDEGKLRQVLINLIGNAIKFTAEGEVTVRATWADARARFVVADTGEGIAPDEMGKLFEPFAQTESGRLAAEGTGLGLAISRDYIWLMGGDIHVESERGVGTRFTFDVPLAEAATDAGAARDTRRVIGLTAGQSQPRVLVVDDTRDNRVLLVTLLGAVGIETREAANGVEAVAVWADWRPDLIWMDMRMPLMDGYAATREIRAREAGLDAEGGAAKPTVIIALSASAFVRERDAILACGCDDFVTKPYREATIFDKLAEHLGLEFAFEDTAVGDEAVAEALAEPDRERFAALPAAVVTRLRAALVAGSAAEALAEVDAVRKIDPLLADFISDRVKAYDFDGLLEVLGSDLTQTKP